jgi:sulfite reductase (NADPH) flavoprotein alpha-component
MIRILHRWPGLVLGALLIVTVLSGAVLSIFPILDATKAPHLDRRLTVAELAQRVQVHHPGLEQITRSASGQISAWWFDDGQPGSAMVDPASGRDLASADPDPVRRWLTHLHRSIFLGDAGRIATAVGAGAMLVLALSGAVLVARRTGGWRRWFTRLRGPLAGRLHTEISRAAVFGLVLSSLTALWMSAETFEFVSVEAEPPSATFEASGATRRAVGDLDALRAIPATDLRALSFPAPDDPQDVFTLKTHQGMGYVDPGTGKLLTWEGLTPLQRFSETVELVHTGQGAWLLGAVLGLMGLSVPALAVTGLIVWRSGRRGRPRLRNNAPAGQADTIVLVGSESGSTWGFAATLAQALRDAGLSVCVAPMSDFAPTTYRNAKRVLILAATYGEGDAPSSARGFIETLRALKDAPRAPLGVLGFGDRSFPAYCAFAKAVYDAAVKKGWSTLLPLDTIDRQSPQDFARWGRILGRALEIELELVHQPVVPATERLTLLERRDYGAAVQVPISILRFALPKASPWQRLAGSGFTRFEPGDLMGVVPEGSPVPRLYSLASGARNRFIEIVVRKHEGGLASEQLCALTPGQTVRAFLEPHPAFHLGRSSTPLILIGAGTGVGPLAGFIRNNSTRRPIHLFFGLRDPDSDFLYGEELSQWASEGKLTELSIAVSRGKHPQYVQDVVRQAGPRIAQAIGLGARVMVCGGRDMARGVEAALRDELEPAGVTPAALRAANRYVEDIY